MISVDTISKEKKFIKPKAQARYWMFLTQFMMTYPDTSNYAIVLLQNWKACYAQSYEEQERIEVR